MQYQNLWLEYFKKVTEAFPIPLHPHTMDNAKSMWNCMEIEAASKPGDFIVDNNTTTIVRLQLKNCSDVFTPLDVDKVRKWFEDNVY